MGSTKVVDKVHAFYAGICSQSHMESDVVENFGVLPPPPSPLHLAHETTV